MRVALVVVAAGLFLGVSSCTPPKPRCGPANCAGCCDALGTCQNGSQNAACGNSGNNCTTCSGNQSCLLGGCSTGGVGGGGNNVGGGSGGGGGQGGGAMGGGAGGGSGGGTTTCDSQTCPGGCCAAGTCIPFASQSMVNCGFGGQLCGSCGTQACNNGVCGANMCNAATCPAGCCAGSQCVTTQLPAQCGISGIACNNCGTGTCNNGQCVGGACNGSTCPNGCCQGNTCVPFSIQGQAACGTGGQACSSCSGTCSNGVCTLPSCNSTTCAGGCCSGNVCIPFGAQNSVNCGAGGVMCAACPPNNTCTNGTCMMMMTGSVTGNACTNAATCTSLGTGSACKTQTDLGGGIYAGGYCTKLGCSLATNPCASDSICIGFSAADGELQAMCLKGCPNPSTAGNPQQSTCRAGYLCYGVTGSGLPAPGVCWLDQASQPVVDAGTPSNKVGLPCTMDSQCNSPPDPVLMLGFCVEATLADGGPSGYPSGYCTANCGGFPNICSSNGTALCLNFGNNNFFCDALCAVPNQGQSNCRVGYVCQGYTRGLPDGGSTPSTDGICEPNCNNPGAGCGTGFSCNAMGYCQ